MKKYSLNSEINSINKFNSYIISLIIFGCFIYTIYIKYFFGIIMWSLVLITLYLVFFKNTFKNKIIEFDSENLYFDEKIVPLKKIIKIENGIIKYEENGENKIVHFNFNYFNQNIAKLKEFIKE
jgi:hypothetical protein